MPIHLKDGCHEFFPLAFQGFMSTGHCFLRIVIEQGRPIFFCSELPGREPSMHGAIDAVFSEGISKLMDARTRTGDFVLTQTNKTGFFRRLFLSPEAERQARRLHAEKLIRQQAILIERAQSGVGSVTYASVVFDASGRAVRHYTSRAHLSALLGVPESTMILDSQQLDLK